MGDYTPEPWRIPYPFPADPPDDPAQSLARATRIHECLDIVNTTATDAGDTAADLSDDIVALRTRIEKLESPPLCLVRQSAVQSIPNGFMEFTPLIFQTTEYDSNGMHPASGTRLTATVAGWYLLAGGFGIVSPAVVSRRGCNWMVKGQISTAGTTMLATPAYGFSMVVPAPVVFRFLAVGDYVELGGFQDSGGAANTAITIASQSWALAVLVKRVATP